MKKIFEIFFTFLVLSNPLYGSTEKIRQIFLLRHAETQVDSTLSKKGKERAIKLAHMLKNQKIEEIIVSSEKRTQQTAQILAEQKNINPRKITMSHEIKNFILSKKNENDNILIVSHSNIIPLVAFELRAPSIYIKHDNYSNLFIITLEGNKFKSMTRLLY